MIVLDVPFEGLMHNFCYFVIQSNDVAFEFTIADFPLMSLNDLITITNILCDVDTSQVAEENQNAFIIGYAQNKAFIDLYYSYMAETNIDLAMAINKTSKVLKL